MTRPATVASVERALERCILVVVLLKVHNGVEVSEVMLYYWRMVCELLLICVTVSCVASLFSACLIRQSAFFIYLDAVIAQNHGRS